MNVKKVFSDELPSCYAVNRIQKDDKDYLLVASEVENSCFAYDINDNFSKKNCLGYCRWDNEHYSSARYTGFLSNSKILSRF